MDEEKLSIYFSILNNNLKNKHITLLIDVPNIAKYYSIEYKFKIGNMRFDSFENFLLEAYIKDYFVDNFFGDNDFRSIYNHSPIANKIDVVQYELDKIMLDIDKIKNRTNIMLHNVILNERLCLLKLISFIGGIKT